MQRPESWLTSERVGTAAEPCLSECTDGRFVDGFADDFADGFGDGWTFIAPDIDGLGVALGERDGVDRALADGFGDGERLGVDALGRGVAGCGTAGRPAFGLPSLDD